MTKEKIYTYFSYIILLLYIIYDMRGVIYPSGSFLSRSMVVAVIACGLCCMFSNMNKLACYKLPQVHIWLICIITFYWIISPSEVRGSVGEAIGTRPTWDFLKCFLYANLSFYTFVFIRMYSNIKYKHLVIWALTIAVFCFIQMNTHRAQVIYEALYDMKGVQLAAGYVFAGLLIFAFLIEKTSYKVCVSTALLIIVFFSAKRGAIILGSVLYIWSVYKTITLRSQKLKFWNIIVALGIIAIVSYGIMDYVSNDDFLMGRLEKTLEGDASHREDMYPAMMKILLTSNLFNLIFGHGMIQSVRLIGNYAHNDWFETGIDFGIVVLFLLGLFFYRFFLFCKSTDDPKKSVVYMILFYFVFKSFVSMGVYSLDSYLPFALLGYIYADVKFLKTAK